MKRQKRKDAAPYFRAILHEEFERRCSKNSRYSLRAFAKFLGLNSGSLSKILSGKQGLAPETARRIARALSLAARQAEMFVASAELAVSRGVIAQGLARKRFEALQKSYVELDKEVFEAVADWRHLALIELASMEAFPLSRERLSNALGMSLSQVDACVNRLTGLGLLDAATGRPTERALLTLTADGVASEAMTAFHRGLLERALEALRSESGDRRDFSALVMKFEMRRLPELREVVRRFERSIVAEFGASKAADSVLCVAVPCFSVVGTELVETETA